MVNMQALATSLILTQLDLSDVMKRVAKEHPHFKADELAVMEQDYRDFLARAAVTPNSSESPSKRVDIVWHNHILFTRKYAEDCESFAGHFIHHTPVNADGMRNDAVGCSSDCGIGAGCVT